MYLFDYLDDLNVVYLDDIVIYSRTSEEHVNHLSLVLSQLRKYTLYVKMEKCEFAQQDLKDLRSFEWILRKCKPLMIGRHLVM